MTESRIIESTQELERAQRAAYALITYSNYVAAWVVLFNRQYGLGDEGRNAFLATLAENAPVRRLQGGIPVSDELTAAYCRGQLTFRAMYALPVEGHPHLARSANFWIPVQSYYAIHGMGLATMMALKIAPPQSHMSFRGKQQLICVNGLIKNHAFGRCGPIDDSCITQKSGLVY